MNAIKALHSSLRIAYSVHDAYSRVRHAFPTAPDRQTACSPDAISSYRPRSESQIAGSNVAFVPRDAARHPQHVLTMKIEKPPLPF